MKFFMKDFVNKCDQICSFRRISFLTFTKKNLMGNFIFCSLSLLVIQTICSEFQNQVKITSFISEEFAPDK